MVIVGKASLSIKSLTHSAAAVTQILGIEPTGIGELGEPFGRERTGADGAPRRRERTHSTWVLEAPDPDPDDSTGFASVESLVSILQARTEALARLRANYYIEIWWNGYSDSTQAGFLLPAELLMALGTLGCDFHGTVYLDEPPLESTSGAGPASA